MLNLISSILLNQAIQLRRFYSIEIHLDWEGEEDTRCTANVQYFVILTLCCPKYGERKNML
jgi:hypothetical protein